MRRSKAGEVTAKAILSEIEELTSTLVTKSLADHQNYPSITTGRNDGWKVSQPGAHLHIALKDRPYADIYRDLYENGSYLLLLLDGAMVQMSYEGSGSEVVKHRLAYIPSPDLRSFQDDPDLYLHERQFAEVVGEQVVPVPIRFDFDATPGVARDLVHPTSHLTLGQYRHCRIPVTQPISPRVFAEFVLHNFYSVPEAGRILLAPRVAPWAPTITPSERAKIHIGIG